MRNRAVEHNMAVFSELSFAICRQVMLSKASTTSNSNESNVKLLTTAVMVPTDKIYRIM